MVRPDYDTLRDTTPFRWYVGSSAYALLKLTGIPLHEYNLDVQACIEAYRRGRPLFRELFPDEQHIPFPSLHTPAVSYGHVNGLGAELHFPENGEVCFSPLYGSLEEGIGALEADVDFATAGMAPFYLDFRERLMAAFPGESVGFSYGLEGPITTAYELRGQGFLIDVMDQPELTAHFLRAVTASIQQFWEFMCGVTGATPFNPSGAGMCDDAASFIPADLFPSLVLPFWEQYYRARTTGVRSAHVEDLRTAQLPYLDQIGLSSFDPSISPLLTPPLIRDTCRTPFAWRLASFHYLTMTCADVRDWVFQAVADGASRVFTGIEHILCDERQAPKIAAFIDAASEVQTMLEKGCTRADVGALVSTAGRKRFWSTWPD